jgi:putative acetyltransferase
MTSVRRFAAGDAPACHAVFFRAVREGAAGHYSEDQRRAWAPEAAMPESWPDWLAREATFVAEEGGRIIGFMVLARDGLLDMAFVMPEAMGQGVAGRLLDVVMAEAGARGLTRLHTEASHLARRFFLCHGWVEEARQEVEKRGQRLVNFRMFRAL